MEVFFQDLLNLKSDPKPQIQGALSAINDWITTESSNESWGERHTICKVDDFTEIVVRRWTREQGTPFHLHLQQSCWFYVLEGTVEETRLALPSDFDLQNNLMSWIEFKEHYKDHKDLAFFENSKKVSLLKEGSWHYIDDSLGFHKMCGYSEVAISLHIYQKLV